MDTSTPSQSTPVDPGLATQHCLTLAIPVDVLKLLELLKKFGGGGPKRVAELFANANPHSAVGEAKLNISPGGGLVHFTDAVLIADNVLLVIAIYDGEWDPYIDAFLNNEVLILGLNNIVIPAALPSSSPPALPVEAHWDDFKSWLKRIDANILGHGRGYKPAAISWGPTASEIRNMLPGLPGTSSGAGEGFTGDPPTQTAPTPVAQVTPVPVDLPDVQGLIVRGYNMPKARHYFLAVADKAKAHAALGKLARGDVEAPLPKVTTAAKWSSKPAATLNIGITASGLVALGLDQPTLGAFPTAFRRNSAGGENPDLWGARDPETCDIVGDVGLNDIGKWDEPYKSAKFHVVVMVQAVDGPSREAVDGALKSFIQGAFDIAGVDDADDLPDSRIHFDYVDGIAQPQLAIEGLPPPTPDGNQGQVAAGAFLWGQHTQPDKTLPAAAVDVAGG